MNKRILFIYNGLSFLINAIEMNLRFDGFEIYRASATTDNVNQHADDADLILLYLSNYTFLNMDFMHFIKELCFERNKTLCMIGDPEELAAVDEVFPPSPRFIRFQRPFDIRQMIAKLSEMHWKATEPLEDRRVLVVDDDEDYCLLLSGWLSRKYTVITVHNGQDALKVLREEGADLVLLDYEMPGMSGPEVLRQILKDESYGRVYVFFLTGRDDRDSVMEALGLKPKKYLLKSMDRDQLIAAVDTFFVGYRRRRVQKKEASE